MPTSLIEGNSLLALDIGSVTTRAAYFDVVEGRYRFIAVGQSPSTAGAPARDVSLGIREAIVNLQALIGKSLLDEDQRMIVPSNEGAGVDSLVATLSAGPVIKTAVFGLLSEVSLDSVQRLARSTYSSIVEAIGMNDKRKANEQIDSIVRFAPDMILIAGGTDGGASFSIEKMLEVIGLACHILPEERRPSILYAGNQELVGDVQGSLEKLSTSLHVSPNIRPSLEVENLAPAQKELAAMYSSVRKQQMVGIEELNIVAGGTLLPTAYAQGRMIRFLSTISDKGILSIDVGASATTVAGAYEGNLGLNVYTHLGLGEPLANILRHTTVEQISQWLPIDLSAAAIHEYLNLKSTYPFTVPATLEDLALEQALARQIVLLAMKASAGNMPRLKAPRPGLLPNYDPIFLGGSVFSSVATLGQSLLMFLDSAQPTGLSNVMLDHGSLLAMLGAAAEHNSILPIHIIESGAFVNLATVISPISSAAYGSPILKIRVTYDDGQESRIDVKQGGLEVIPLPVGRSAQLRVETTGRTDAGLGPGRGYAVDGIKGSALGIIVDARGRPLHLPPDPVRRRELIKKWLWTLGG